MVLRPRCPRLFYQRLLFWMGMCVLWCPKPLCAPQLGLANAPVARPHVQVASAVSKYAIHCLQCDCVPQSRKKTNKQREHNGLWSEPEYGDMFDSIFIETLTHSRSTTDGLVNKISWKRCLIFEERNISGRFYTFCFIYLDFQNLLFRENLALIVKSYFVFLMLHLSLIKVCVNQYMWFEFVTQKNVLVRTQPNKNYKKTLSK